MPRRASTAASLAPMLVALTVIVLGAGVPTQNQAPPPSSPQGAGAAVTTGSPDATGKITGQVLAADTGQPVKRATVWGRGGTPQTPVSAAAPGQFRAQVTVTVDGRSGSGLPPGMAQRETTTDEAGRFEMTDLPAGRYTVGVQAPAMFLLPPSQTILLAAGGTAAVTFRIDRGGVITGRVLDHEGDPLVRAQVNALQRRSLGGEWRLTPTGSGGNASSDDLGQFRLYGLPPGEYYVSATCAMPAPVMEAHVAGGPPRVGYAPTLYPSSLTVDGAQKVTVRAGQDTGGIDISVVRARLGSVSGRATDSAGNPITGSRGYVSLRPSGEVSQSGVGFSTRRKEDGTFVVANVPPGRYVLTAVAGFGEGSTAGPREAAFRRLIVDGDDVAADIQTNLGATVSGRVVIEGATPDLPGGLPEARQRSRAYVSARTVESAIDFGSGPGASAEVGDALTFRLIGLRGTLALGATGYRKVLKSVTYAGQDIMASGLALEGTEEIDGVIITMTTDVAQIDGAVLTDAGDPAEAWLLVFPEDSSKWFPGSPFVRLSRTLPASASESGGRGAPMPGMQPLSVMATRPGGFVVSGLVPGRYLVAALPVDAATAMVTPPDMDRDALEKLRAAATIVAAVAGQPTAVELRLPR